MYSIVILPIELSDAVNVMFSCSKFMSCCMKRRPLKISSSDCFYVDSGDNTLSEATDAMGANIPGVNRPMTSRPLRLQARYQLIFCSPRVNFCVQVTFPPTSLSRSLSTSLAHALLAPHSPSLEFLAIAQVAS